MQKGLYFQNFNNLSIEFHLIFFTNSETTTFVSKANTDLP